MGTSGFASDRRSIGREEHRGMEDSNARKGTGMEERTKVEEQKEISNRRRYRQQSDGLGKKKTGMYVCRAVARRESRTPSG